jgi:hypothetical protein
MNALQMLVTLVQGMLLADQGEEWSEAQVKRVLHVVHRMLNDRIAIVPCVKHLRYLFLIEEVDTLIYDGIPDDIVMKLHAIRGQMRTKKLGLRNALAVVRFMDNNWYTISDNGADGGW